jgi:hypothetical protein
MQIPAMSDAVRAIFASRNENSGAFRAPLFPELYPGYSMTGIEKAEPSLIPDGQRAVTVFVRV